MRHAKLKKRLNLSQGHRRAILKNLARGIFENKRIITTVEKAKEAKPYIEKIITRAKKGTLHDIRMIEKKLNDRRLVAKIVKEIAPHFKDRQGGYTRIIRYKKRRGDNATLCVFELVGDFVLIKKVEEKKAKEKDSKEAKKKENKKEDKK